MICIIPNWFQLPLSYAVSRSMFAIDVRFTDKLERGLFAFYNFPAKRILYIAGKRGHNYRVVKPTFMGKFTDGYGVDEQEYRYRKRKDMEEYEKENPVKKTKSMIEKDLQIKLLKQFRKNMPNLSTKELADIIGVSTRTILRWDSGDMSEMTMSEDNYNNKHTNKKDIIVNEEELDRFEQERKKEYTNIDIEPVNPISTEGSG